MSVVIQDVVRGALKVDNLPDRACFTSFEELLQALPTFLSVEVPTSVSGTLVSREPPSEDDRDKIWYRRNSSGAFVGTYAFQNGQWRPLYQFAPGQIIWMYGNSARVPEGFVLIQEGDTMLLSSVVNALKSTYISDGAGGYSYFAVRYVGF